jgi:hypothetical protein
MSRRKLTPIALIVLLALTGGCWEPSEGEAPQGDEQPAARSRGPLGCCEYHYRSVTYTDVSHSSQSGDDNAFLDETTCHEKYDRSPMDGDGVDYFHQLHFSVKRWTRGACQGWSSIYAIGNPCTRDEECQDQCVWVENAAAGFCSYECQQLGDHGVAEAPTYTPEWWGEWKGTYLKTRSDEQAYSVIVAQCALTTGPSGPYFAALMCNIDDASCPPGLTCTDGLCLPQAQ